MTKRTKKPWPTNAVMNQIYDMHLWGGRQFDFYSGTGSHDPKIIEPYLKAVIAVLESFNEPLVVCDLGCGDFNVGKHITKYAKTYIAVDIVESLIHRNKQLYKADNLAFYCLDIIKDSLPLGDCMILRQVLQHLSNKDIEDVIKKLAVYKYIILTEHLPLGDFVPNKDIISGQGIRLKHNSGVNLLEPPFSLKIKNQKELGTHLLENEKGRLVTTLFEVF